MLRAARRAPYPLLAWWLCVGWLVAQATVCSAQSLPPEGAHFTDSSYSIDITQGTVLSASRVTGLSGAFTALAEGMEGGLSNPAAVAARSAASADWWDYWVALSLTYPFDNGTSTTAATT